MRVEWLLGLSPDIHGYPAGSPFSGTSGPRRCHGDRGDERGQKETKKDTPAERERKDSPSEIHQEALPPLDTNVVLRQVDLLEAFTFGTDLIVPQTVLDEVRHRSLPIFNRLKSLINETDPTGKFIRGWIFWNETRLDTHIRREPDESINDRNDRAIREVCKWYKAHLSSHNLDIVLLIDDRANFEKATQQHVHASTTKGYVEMMAEESSKVRLDLVASSGSAFESVTQIMLRRRNSDLTFIKNICH